VTQTNTALITEAFQKIGVVADGRAPTATQTALGMTVLNDNMATQQKDGWHLGWFPQTNLAANAPLADENLGDVKLCLCAWLAPHYSVVIPPPLSPDDRSSLGAQIDQAFRRLNKRSMLRTECDLGELSRPQGGPWGGPNYL
jgi:hypothetical protein